MTSREHSLSNTKETQSRQQSLRQINYCIKQDTTIDRFVDIASATRQDASSVAVFSNSISHIATTNFNLRFKGSTKTPFQPTAMSQFERESQVSSKKSFESSVSNLKRNPTYSGCILLPIYRTKVAIIFAMVIFVMANNCKQMYVT